MGKNGKKLNAVKNSDTMSRAAQKYSGVTRYLPKPPKLLEEERYEFLEILKEKDGNLTASAKKIGVSRRTVYRRMTEDLEFKKSVEQVRNECDLKFVDDLEKVSRTEALVPKNKAERIFHLRANNPEKYRERTNPFLATQVNVTVSGVAIKDRAKIIEEIERNRIDESEIQGWREEDTSQK